MVIGRRLAGPSVAAAIWSMCRAYMKVTLFDWARWLTVAVRKATLAVQSLAADAVLADGMIAAVDRADEPTHEQVEDEPVAERAQRSTSAFAAGSLADFATALEAANQSPSVRAAVEALQQAVGNRSVAGQAHRRTLARLKKSYQGLDPVAAVGRALSDDEEDDALDLMRALTTADQANAVLRTYQRPAVKCFGNKTMGQGMAILVSKGGHLREALSWMDDEGTDWRLQSAVIRQASMDERKWIVTADWKRHWIKELGNKEMAALVKLLPLSLADRLEWMHEEGTDWDLMRDVILASPAEQRAPLMQDDRMRAIFLDECSKRELYNAVSLLGGPLSLQLSWMARRGCDDDWIWERVKAINDAKQRVAVYMDRPALFRLLEMSKQDRLAMAKALGGVPDQLMALFQRDLPIEGLNQIPGKTPSAAWVDALIKYRSRKDDAGNIKLIDANDVLWIGSGAPDAWAPYLGPRLNDILSRFHDTIRPEFNVKVFWAAYAQMPAAAAHAKDLMHMVGVLTGVEPFLPGRSGKVPHRDFLATDPNDDTAREFMDILRPGGPSGPAGMSREQLATGKLAFIYQDTSTNPPKAVDTSYFSDPWILIQVDQNGARSTNMVSSIGSDPALAVGPTPRTVGSTLTYFQNHVRHEIGHAVGRKKVGNMDMSGNDFAMKYGGWKKSSKSTFRKTLWSDVAKPRGGWPTVMIAGNRITISNDDARNWCMGIMEDGKEDTDNPLGAGAAGNMQRKLAALKGSLWSTNRLIDYMIAIGDTKASDLRDDAYQFPGFTPDDPVQIFSTRWDNDFVSYDREAHNNFMGLSWYALSSPFEMFAEMYTIYYSQGRLPARRGTSDPQAFFNQLENQHDPEFGS